MTNQVPLHVSLIAIPEVVISTLHGIYDVLNNAFEMLAGFDAAIPDTPPFRVEIVGVASGPVTLAGGLAIQTHRRIGEIAATDVVIVPSVMLGSGGWRTGRYPELVDWLGAMHDRGAALGSACSGVFFWRRPVCSTATGRRSTGTTRRPSGPSSRACRSARSRRWWPPAIAASSSPPAPPCPGTTCSSCI